MVSIDMEEYLKVSEMIDWQHPTLMERANQLDRNIMSSVFHHLQEERP
jgi:hypothetical protein